MQTSDCSRRSWERCIFCLSSSALDCEWAAMKYDGDWSLPFVSSILHNQRMCFIERSQTLTSHPLLLDTLENLQNLLHNLVLGMLLSIDSFHLSHSTAKARLHSMIEASLAIPKVRSQRRGLHELISWRRDVEFSTKRRHERRRRG